MMKRTLYVVCGSTGEYSDWQEWFVAAYLDSECADQHAALANEQVKGAENWTYEEQDAFVGKFHLDTSCRIDYTGTKYSVQEVPLVGHVDEYIEVYTKE